MSKLIELIRQDARDILDHVDLSPLDGKSILLTGASGLLGLTLLACFQERMRRSQSPIEVIAVTRLPPPPHFAPFFDQGTVRTLTIDLADLDACRSLPTAAYIIHAAGYGQPGKFLENPVKTIQINTTALALMLEKQPADGALLFLSSSEIYSGSVRFPHHEDDIGTTSPAHARACYIEGKRCGEAICHAFAAAGRNVKAARLALAYGPGTRADDQRVLNSLIQKALIDRRIALMDAGAAHRTYGYIADVVEMLLAILLHGRQTVYNVGGNSDLTILELAQSIGALTGVPVIVPALTRALAGAPEKVALDLSRVCTEFGKTSFVPMAEGLRRTIEWQRALYGGGQPAAD